MDRMTFMKMGKPWAITFSSVESQPQSHSIFNRWQMFKLYCTWDGPFHYFWAQSRQPESNEKGKQRPLWCAAFQVLSRQKHLSWEITLSINLKGGISCETQMQDIESMPVQHRAASPLKLIWSLLWPLSLCVGCYACLHCNVQKWNINNGWTGIVTNRPGWLKCRGPGT